MIVIDRLRDIIDSYDGLILDVWGVLYDGSGLYPDVLDCLEKLAAQKKQVAILSNSPRRAHLMQDRLREHGVRPDLYTRLFTSGEETYESLTQRSDPWYKSIGTNCYYWGKIERDAPAYEAIGLSQTLKIEAADFILNSGPLDESLPVDSYDVDFSKAIAHNIPMICSNPDIVVMHGGRELLCAGALAKRYEELGGYVHYHGKPYPSVYNSLLKTFKDTPKARLLAVGDNLKTDIKGAKNAQIDSLLVTCGVHEGEIAPSENRDTYTSEVTRLCDLKGVHPTYSGRLLRW